MAKQKKTETLETPAQTPLEFWIEPQGDGTALMVLARASEDGYVGKARLVEVEGMTLFKLGRHYEEMLSDYEAEHGPLA